MCNECKIQFEDNMKQVDDAKEDSENYLNKNSSTTINSATTINEGEHLHLKIGHLAQMIKETLPDCCRHLLRENDYAIEIDDKLSHLRCAVIVENVQVVRIKP
ncbi:unnamed protein product, partial [Rotaria sordida]